MRILSFLRSSAAQKDQALLNARAEIRKLRDQVLFLTDQASSYLSDNIELQGKIEELKAEREASSAKCLIAENNLNQARRDAEAASRKAALSTMQSLALKDAIATFADRYKIDPAELAQLGLGTFVPGPKGERGTIALYDLEDAKDALDFGMKNQATAAKFRQLKEHFRTHQQAVTIVLDGLDALGKKNVVTKEDMRKLREIRRNVGELIRRTI